MKRKNPHRFPLKSIVGLSEQGRFKTQFYKNTNYNSKQMIKLDRVSSLVALHDFHKKKNIIDPSEKTRQQMSIQNQTHLTFVIIAEDAAL